jgi:hypothetical protein
MKNNDNKHEFGSPLRTRRDYGSPGSGLGLLAKDLLKVARLLLCGKKKRGPGRAR